ncbi:gametocyte-specific factor 1 homolog [Diachasma alloeum]|uniref:gametocyte-specific factor 1 homolog n=1 Tax=Diachasma alloeum TaxID=454923 RepID=UPI0007381C97|nr:gametocyte-specific factor 1 homolog [Diachasma alloeum]
MADTGDPMVTCPLDKSHHILKSRLIFHLVRCKKNHDLSGKATCVFNSTHIVDKDELKIHHLTCLDRREMQEFRYESDEADQKQWEGIITLQDVVKVHEESSTYGESWDDDPVVGTYDPYKANENKDVLNTLMVASKSEKKAWRKYQRQKMAQFESSQYSEVNTPKEVQTKASLEPLRSPKAVTSISMQDNGKSVDQLEKKTQSTATVADQLIKNLTLLNISDNPGKTEDFPALQPPKSFSSAVKESKLPGKRQASKKTNCK